MATTTLFIFFFLFILILVPALIISACREPGSYEKSTEEPTDEPTEKPTKKPPLIGNRFIDTVLDLNWEQSIRNEGIYYYSYPLCIDEHGHYILRECRNGEFLTRIPTCHQTQYEHVCFDGLELQESQIHQNMFCYLKSDNILPFDYNFECPYKQLFLSHSVDFYKEFDNVWMNYHLPSNPVGSAMCFVPDHFLNHALNFETRKDKNNQCPGYLDRSFVDDCQGLRQRICVYPAVNLNNKHFLEVQPKFCDNKCYISWKKNSVACICPRKFSDCPKPAVYPLGTPGCAIGIDIEGGMSLIWMATKEPVRNVFWSTNHLQVQPGRYIVMTETGWTTADHADCIMCEMTFDIRDPAIEINVDSITKEPGLIVTNKERIFQAYFDAAGSVYDIRCYADDNKCESMSFEEMRTQKLTMTGTWQCMANDLADTTKIILSNKIQLDYGYHVYLLHIKSETDATNILHKICTKIFVSYKLVFLKYIELDSWIKIYKVEIPSTEDFRHSYFKLKQAIWTPELIKLRAEVFNLKFCPELRTKQDDRDLLWPEAHVGQKSEANCYDGLGNRLLIKCVGNTTLGANFTRVSHCLTFSWNATEQISDLENSDAPPHEILTNLTNILQENSSITSAGANKTANILEKLVKEGEAQDIVDVISQLIMTDPIVLHKSQKSFNATDRVLYALDQSLLARNLTDSQEVLTSENLECLLMNSESSQYAGIAYYTTGKIDMLFENVSLQDVVIKSNLQSAVYITYNEKTSGRFTVAVFKSPVLFNEEEKRNYNLFGRVFGVTVTGDLVRYNVTLVFPKEEKSNCAYWLYGKNQHGRWHIDVDPFYIGKFAVCIYNHTTHYGYLIMSKNRLDLVGDQFLSIMTSIECGFSVFGLSAMVATAIAFPTWRKQHEKLLHYCAVLLAQTILLFANSNSHMSTVWCTIAGSLLHFTVLSQFAWMLLIAHTQHRQLVQVFKTKSGLFDSRWIVAPIYAAPLLIVTIALSVDVDAYARMTNARSEFRICYPSGNILLYTVLVPTGVVTLINAHLFWNIVDHLLASGTGDITGVGDTWLERNASKLKVIFLMVFTLGITWWLGFAAFFFDSSLLLYIFSIATAPQGFLIFLFNVVNNAHVRGLYQRLFIRYYLKLVQKI